MNDPIPTFAPEDGADDDPTAYDPRFDDEEDHALVRGERRARRKGAGRPGPGARRDPGGGARGQAAREDALAAGFDDLTYRPKRHEREWLAEALGAFFLLGDVTDVLRMIKGGKEANVYQVAVPPATGAPYAAAKIYRPRAHRSLRNDARYRHGRAILSEDGKALRDARAWHAVITGTDMGKDLTHASWMSHEYVTLARLHAAGADVPRPIARGPNVILMSYVGDDDRPATTLNHVALAPDEAERLFRRVVDNIARMLSLGIVHGDLSAYNVLYHEGAITLIDFPQVVQPRDNPDARPIFERDVARVCDYFATQGVAADAAALAADLWATHVPSDLELEHRPEFQEAKLAAELAAIEARAFGEED